MKDIFKKYIDITVPVEACNFRCSYCYISQYHKMDRKKSVFNYSVDEVVKGLSVKRLGGKCLINLCGIGETLFSQYTIDLAKGLLTQGHYVIIVTNGCAQIKSYLQLADFPKEYLNRLIVKFSFHYVELKKRKLLDTYWKHVNIIRKSGAGISLEMCPSDETMQYKEEIKKVCLENVGALPHVTIPRSEKEKDYPIITEHTPSDFINFWKEFDSDMFDIKVKSFGVKRTEFCYAGLWSAYLNIGNGELYPCHCQNAISKDIFKNLNEKIPFKPVGICKAPYCVNAHCGMCMGCLPDVKVQDFSTTRDRICKDGSHWISKECRDFLSQKLYDNNSLLNEKKFLKKLNKKPFKYYKYKFLIAISFGKMKKKYENKLAKWRQKCGQK